METLRHANDNQPFNAEFEKIPFVFLQAYQQELFEWARELTKGNMCTIDLWNYPGASVISSNFQGQATLKYDAYGDQVTKRLKFVVRPASEEDEARVRKHSEELPAIMAAHKAAAQAKAGQRPKMARWVFDGTLPEYFVLRYQAELREWARNFKKIGTIKHIMLREGSLADLSPDEMLGAELVQVTLKCKIERVRGDEIELVASALDEEQERRIRKHCEKMQRNKIPAGAVLVEPERPFVPFMPNVGGGTSPIKPGEH